LFEKAICFFCFFDFKTKEFPRTLEPAREALTIKNNNRGASFDSPICGITNKKREGTSTKSSNEKKMKDKKLKIF